MKKFQKPVKRLKGKELANYIKINKHEFQDNGDALCLAAGYGELDDNGLAKCNLPKFLTELSEVMENNG